MAHFHHFSAKEVSKANWGVTLELCRWQRQACRFLDADADARAAHHGATQRTRAGGLTATAAQRGTPTGRQIHYQPPPACATCREPNGKGHAHLLKLPSFSRLRNELPFSTLSVSLSPVSLCVWLGSISLSVSNPSCTFSWPWLQRNRSVAILLAWVSWC